MSHWIPFAICCSLFLFALLRMTTNRRRVRSAQRKAVSESISLTLKDLTEEDQQWLEDHGWNSPLRVPDAVAYIHYVSAGADPDGARMPIEWHMADATTAIGRAAIKVGPGRYSHFGLWSEAGKFLYACPIAHSESFATDGLLFAELRLTSRNRTWTFL